MNNVTINKYWISIFLLVSIISFYYFGITGYIYYFNDVYAYLSYAENFYNQGYIYDITTLPGTAPITPQNGIVLIYAGLRLFTEDILSIVQIVIGLLTINLIFIFYIIYKIGKLLEIEENILRLFIISLVFSFYFYAYYVTPTNDGFYISLFLLSIYLILKLIQENGQESKKYWIYLFFISITVPLFRLQGMIEIIASVIVFTLVQKNYKKAFFSFLLLISAFISVRVIVYFLINDFSGLEKLSENLVIYNIENLTNSIKALLSEVIPSMYLNFQSDYLTSSLLVTVKYIASFVILVYTIFIFFKSFLDKNAKIFFLILIIFGNYGALILFNVMVDRYIYINGTLLSLIILYYLKYQYRKYFVFLLIFLSLLTFSARFFYKDFPKNEIINNIEYISKTYKEYNLITESNRHFYFYLKKPTIIDFKYIDISLPIILIGESKFVENKIKEIENNYNLSYEKKNLSIYWSPMRNTKYETYEINILDKRQKDEN